jgi:hypothetical protein
MNENRFSGVLIGETMGCKNSWIMISNLQMLYFTFKLDPNKRRLLIFGIDKQILALKNLILFHFTGVRLALIKIFEKSSKKYTLWGLI